MAKQGRKKQQKKRGRIKFKQSARLVHKNDATRVYKSGIDTIPRMQAQMPRSNGMVLKVKVKRK